MFYADCTNSLLKEKKTNNQLMRISRHLYKRDARSIGMCTKTN